MSYFDDMIIEEICENLSHNLNLMRTFLNCVYDSNGERNKKGIYKSSYFYLEQDEIYYGDGKYFGFINYNNIMSLDFGGFVYDEELSFGLEMFFKYSKVENIIEITIPNASLETCKFLEKIFTTKIIDARYIGLNTIYIEKENNINNVINLCEIFHKHFQMYDKNLKSFNPDNIDLSSLNEGIVICDMVDIKFSKKRK